MTKEQEEAIERLKEDVKYSDLADTVDDDCTICFVEDVEIVLNLIQEQQKENEKKDKIIDEMLEEFKTKTLMYSDMSKEAIKQYFENQAKM